LKPSLIIGIAGASSSGKSRLISQLMKNFTDETVAIIDMDGFHIHDRKERELLDEFPEDEKANNFDKLFLAIEALKSGQHVVIPTYDHKKGGWSDPKVIFPAPIVFVEGLHAGSINKISGKNLIDFTIFTYPDEDLRVDWKLKRDVIQRGYSREEAIKQIKEREIFVEKFILPQVDLVEIVFVTTQNNISGLKQSVLVLPGFYSLLTQNRPSLLKSDVQIDQCIFHEKLFYRIIIKFNNEIFNLLEIAKKRSYLKNNFLIGTEIRNNTLDNSSDVISLIILIALISIDEEGNNE
jgi:uridine kinase